MNYIPELEELARHFTGRPVTVRLIAREGFDGGIHKDLAGRCVLELSPQLLEDADDNPSKFARTLCHELAHIVRHFDELPRVDADHGEQPNRARAEFLLSHPEIEPTVKRREDEANQLAGQWFEVIAREYRGYLSACGDPVMAILKILYHRVKGPNQP